MCVSFNPFDGIQNQYQDIYDHHDIVVLTQITQARNINMNLYNNDKFDVT